MYKNYEVSRYLVVTFSHNVIFINCSFSFFQSQFLRIGMIFIQRKTRTKPKSIYAHDDNKGWFYKLALLDFELIFEVKMQESEGV